MEKICRTLQLLSNGLHLQAFEDRSTVFVEYLIKHFPFKTECVQTNNEAETIVNFPCILLIGNFLQIILTFFTSNFLIL